MTFMLQEHISAFYSPYSIVESPVFRPLVNTENTSIVRGRLPLELTAHVPERALILQLQIWDPLTRGTHTAGYGKRASTCSPYRCQ